MSAFVVLMGRGGVGVRIAMSAKMGSLERESQEMVTVALGDRVPANNYWRLPHCA